MKKLLSSLSIVAVCSGAAYAQPSPGYLSSEITYSYDAGYSLTDSNFYKYGAGPRKFMKDLDEWSYDTLLTYNTWAGGGMEAQGKSSHQFDANGRVLVSTSSHMDGGSWVMNNRVTRTYDANGNVTMQETETITMSGPLQRYAMALTTYNTNNQPTVVTNMYWDATAGQYVSQMKSTYTYNSSNLAETILEEMYVSGNWEPRSRTTNTYVGTNNTESLREDYIAGNWMNSSRELYQYNSSNDVTDMQFETWDGTAWVEIYNSIQTYDSRHNMLSSEFIVWNGTTFEPDSRQVRTYNMFDQVLTSASYSWNGSAFLPDSGDDSVRYKYEFPISVGKTPAVASSIRVFPVPASSHITLQMAKTEAFTATLYDMTGKLVKSFTGNQAKQQLNVHDVPVGNYVLNIQVGANVKKEKVTILR